MLRFEFVCLTVVLHGTNVDPDRVDAAIHDFQPALQCGHLKQCKHGRRDVVKVVVIGVLPFGQYVYRWFLRAKRRATQ